MVRPPGQGRQLPGRGVRGADRRPAARAGRHAALSATALDRRPEALRPGRDPGVRAAVALEGGVGCALARCVALPGENPGRKTLAPAGSTRGGSGGDEWFEAPREKAP